jgi:Holliday junction resolvasome RuvABC endonuclease subunit
MDKREVRQKVSEFLMAHENQDFTLEEVADALGIAVDELDAAVNGHVIRCSFGEVQYFE